MTTAILCSRLADMSNANLDRLQRVQNTLARVVNGTPRRDHITPVLAGLHWLHVRARIKLKVATLVYKIRETRQLDVSIGTSGSLQTYTYTSFFLCQSSGSPAVRNRYSILSSRSRTVWNSLPDNIRLLNSLETFRSHPKKHLFNLSYCN